jgi:phospholipid/cholesterol/gamma-HCH transport system substrate-binding protein
MLRSKTIREGSVGLLIIVGVLLFAGLAIWLRHIKFSQEHYQIIVRFPNVNGIEDGAPVRYRGVDVGRVSGITPNSNGIDVTLEISDPQLRIPKNSQIQANRLGLIGEATIDIIPLEEVSEKAQNVNPMDANCDATLIVCSNNQTQPIPGEMGTSFEQLIPGIIRLSEIYSDPKFFQNVNVAAENAGLAAGEIAKLSRELTLLSSTVRGEVSGLSSATKAVTQTAHETSKQITKTSAQFTKTASQLGDLAATVNLLVQDNQDNVVQTLDSITNTSDQLRTLLISFNPTLDRLNSALDGANTKQLIQNLETLTANATEASANLRDLSKNLNDPVNWVMLQKTLDSARVTFENTQKITSDLDELTGNPEFRTNLLNLVNGLSKLVSSTQQLEQQIQTAKTLNPVVEDLQQQVATVQILESVTQQLQQEIKTPQNSDPLQHQQTAQALKSVTQELEKQVKSVQEIEAVIQQLKTETKTDSQVKLIENVPVPKIKENPSSLSLEKPSKP